MQIYQKNNSSKDILLTIASPYYNDNPSKWIRSLLNSKVADQVEIIVVDDGTKDDAIDKEVCELIDIWPGRAKRIKMGQNIGRSGARNLAIDEAIGKYILFIDADMIPKNPDYLELYFDIIERKAAAIVFGGFDNVDFAVDHDHLLNFDIAKRSDCRTAEERANRGAYSVASNNLLGSRDLFIKERFDSEFKGWGWEDTEWAIRVVNKGYGLLHIDNPAIHYGLDSSRTMLRKYREAADNLAVMVRKHPHAQKFLAVKAARFVSKLPFHKLLRPIAEKITIDEKQIVPIFIRRMAIKFWRASWAADALKNSIK